MASSVVVDTAPTTLQHTELLNGEARDVWTVSKHVVALLPDLSPQHFAAAEFESGTGGLGSVAVYHFGPEMPKSGSVKHRIDNMDDESQTLAYTVIDGYTSNFRLVMQFTQVGDKKTMATWTMKYVDGEDKIPRSSLELEEVKTMVVITLKTLERAVLEKRVVRHTRTLAASADSIWNILMNEDLILPKVIPHIIASYEYLEGNGEHGSIRLLKLGHAIPGGLHVLERIDINDVATKTWGYTVLQGDPKYKYLSAVMTFQCGSQENTTLASWSGVFVPQSNAIPPPDLALHVWTVFENVAKSSPQVVY